MTVGTGSSMCAPLADACSGFVSSLVLGSDAVPRLSHHTVENLLDELIRKSPALNFAETVRSSVASTFAPRSAAPAAARGAAVAEARPDSVQLAELPKGEGFSALDLGESGSIGAADGPFVKAARDAAEMGERGVYASTQVEDDAAEGEEANESEAAMVGDGMATAQAETPARAEEEGNVWLRLLRPVEGLIRGTREQQTPFSPEALRAYAERWRDKAAAAAAEPGPDADLAGVSVADPLRYLSQSGISRSDRTANAAAEAVSAPAPDLQRPLPSAPSGVQRMDAEVLREADAGHEAAAASDAAPPPPMYPPGRVLWLIPLRRKTALGGSMDVEVASSTALLSCPKTFTAAEIFQTDSGPAVPPEDVPPGEEEEAEEAVTVGLDSPVSPVELEDRLASGRDLSPGVDGGSLAEPSVPGSGAPDVSQGRSLFIQLAGDAMLGPVAVPPAARRSAGVADAAAEGGPEVARTPARPQRQDGLTQAGADVAYDAFDSGAPGPRSDSSGSWGDLQAAEGAAGDGGAARKGEDVAPNWLLNLVRRPLGGGGPAAPAQAADAPRSASPAEAAGGPAAPATPTPPPVGGGGEEARGVGDPVAGSEAAGTPPSTKAKVDVEVGGGATAAAAASAPGQAQFVIEDSGGADPEGSGRGAVTVHDLAVLDVTHQRDVFNYLTLGADMIQDHLPDSYTKAIALLKRHARQERAAADQLSGRRG